jgi:hypothetical protein
MAAYDRLEKDGAYSTTTVRRRVALIAAEIKLGDLETKVLLKGRWLTAGHIREFAEACVTRNEHGAVSRAGEHANPR